MSAIVENQCIQCSNESKNESKDESKDENAYKLYCGICGDDYSKNIMYKLPCNHEFHYDCLIKTFQYSNNKYNSCPYCRRKVGYLSVPEGRTPVKYINSPTLLITGGYKCKAILKSGKRCGQECGSNVVSSYNLCKRHLKL